MAMQKRHGLKVRNEIDARLVTLRNGVVIGLAAEDPQDMGSTLSYNEIALIAASIGRFAGSFRC